jgi:hypothetical protein
MVSPAPVMRWRIETAMPGPQRQMVRCGEIGLSRTAAIAALLPKRLVTAGTARHKPA